MNNKPIDNRVQLGCGTLILIAIIVMLFSGGSDTRKLRRELDAVNRKLDGIERKVDELSEGFRRKPELAPVPPGTR
jgi:hypothetical protein